MPPNHKIQDLSTSHIPILDEKLTALIDAFDQDPRTRTDKTFYYIWDFAQRTRHNLRSVDPAKYEAGDEATVETYTDAFQRSIMCQLLITDTTGKTAVLTGRNPNTPIEFGAVLKERARALTEITPEDDSAGPSEPVEASEAVE